MGNHDTNRFFKEKKIIHALITINMESSTKFLKTANNWDNSYLLDIPMIDNQHKRFFFLFDSLSLMVVKDEQKDRLIEIVDELEKYTHYHFTTEERLMYEAKINESEINIHKSQHQIFIKKVEEFQIASRYQNALLSEQMLQFMRKWILMHIKGTDAKYADTIKSYLKSKSE